MTPVPVEKLSAQRLAPPPLADQIVAAGGKKETVAIIDDQRQRLARPVDREDLCRGFPRLDQRLMELLEGQRIVEQRRIDHASRDRQFIRCQHHAPTAPAATNRPARRDATTCRPTTHAAVRNTSVPSVAHAAPSMDSAGMSCAFRPRLTTKATAHAAAYQRSPLHA